MNRATIAVLTALAWLAAAPALAQSGQSPSAVLQAPQTVAFGAPLTLNGSQSFDPDGQITRYVWTKLTGSGGAMPLNQAFGTLEPTYLVPQPSGRPLAIGRHRFQLVVNDNAGNSSQPDAFEVIVVDNIAPTAVLDAPRTVAVGAAVQLSGARSTDVGGAITQYVWTHLEGDGGSMPINQSFVTTTNTFVVPQTAGNPLAVGRHRFRLVVTDDAGNQSQPTEAPVIVLDSIPPTAVLEGPKQVMQVQPFQLSAMRSSDIGGKITQYRLSRIAGSANGPMPLGQEFVTEANVFAVTQSPTSYLGLGRHVFRVVAVDDSGNQSKPAEFPVEVTAPLPSGRSK